MTLWVDAVRRGVSLDDIIPVNAPPSRVNVDDLASRLDFLQNEILDERHGPVESDS